MDDENFDPTDHLEDDITIKEEPIEDNVVSFVKGFLNIPPTSKKTSSKRQHSEINKKEEKDIEMDTTGIEVKTEPEGEDRISPPLAAPDCIIQVNGMEVFSCHACDFVSVDWKNLMIHNEHAHLTNDPEEDLSDSSGSNQITHQMKTIDLLSCKHCNFVTADYESFKTHLEKKHNGKVTTKKKYPKKKKLPVGVLQQISVLHKCHLCSKSYDNENSLKEHVKLYHEEDFSCEFCGSKLSQRKSLKEHQRLYCKALKCQLCSMIFKDLESLEKHATTSHTDPAEVECDICHKIFSNLLDLKTHEVTCQQLNQCRECYGKFPTSDELEEHSKTCQLSEKPYKCPFCIKSFLKKSDYHSHVGHKHNGEPHFECCECSLKFLTKGKLKRHKLVFHLKEKEFQCEMCPKSFYTSNLKKRHFQVIHQRLLAMKCKVCGNELINATAMKKHLEKLHNITS